MIAVNCQVLLRMACRTMVLTGSGETVVQDRNLRARSRKALITGGRACPLLHFPNELCSFLCQAEDIREEPDSLPFQGAAGQCWMNCAVRIRTNRQKVKENAGCQQK